MHPQTVTQAIGVVAALWALGVGSAHAELSRAEFQAGKDRISAAYKVDKAACKPLTGNAQDVCEEEAEAKEKVARAELEFNHSGLAKDQTHVWEVKAKTAYEVAREKCDDRAGNAKDVCVQEAKAVRDKAMADARLSKEIRQSRQEAGDDKAHADYEVAVEKCDALSGSSKAACVASAKAKHGQR